MIAYLYVSGLSGTWLYNLLAWSAMIAYLYRSAMIAYLYVSGLSETWLHNLLAWSARRYSTTGCRNPLAFVNISQTASAVNSSRKVEVNLLHLLLVFSRGVKMKIFLSRLFDSFSRRLFDYSTLFPTVTVKFPSTIYYRYCAV
jgi:hypothetical protein